MPKVSVIIRTKNEERFLRAVLEALEQQTFKDFEKIIVDDSSDDRTLDIAEEHDCKIIHVPKGEFTHPFSSNLGAEAATGNILAYTNGHAIPATNTWLEKGLGNFSDPKVAGVTGKQLANPEANRIEKTLYTFVNLFKSRRKEVVNQSQIKMGVLSTVNALIRRDLWDQYNFNEDFAFGGEDRDWARYWVSKGFKIVWDPEFNIYHSHNLSPLGLLRLFLGWFRMGKPREFKAQENQFK